jgi:hypothetical protein
MIPLSNVDFEIGAMRESNCVSNAEHLRVNQRSALFSTERRHARRQVQIEEFLLQQCHARDLTITSRS